MTQAAIWRDRLKEGRNALFAAYLERPRARVLLGALTELTDAVLCDIWRAQALPECAALVAVGEVAVAGRGRVAAG